MIANNCKVITKQQNIGNYGNVSNDGQIYVQRVHMSSIHLVEKSKTSYNYKKFNY